MFLHYLRISYSVKIMAILRFRVARSQQYLELERRVGLRQDVVQFWCPLSSVH